MLTIVFGAGASHDSIRNGSAGLTGDYQPPVTKDIFNQDLPHFGATLEELYECAPIVPRLRRAVAEGRLFEDELEAISNDSRHIHARALIGLRFYLAKVLEDCGTNWGRRAHGITNYTELLYEVEEWRATRHETVCLITFNYDTLIEQALHSVFSYDFSKIDFYVTKTRPYFLFKLHGSVSWRQLTSNVVPANAWPWVAHELAALGNELELLDQYVVAGGYSYKPPAAVQDRAMIPAIAVPLRTKASFACPADHLHTLEHVLSATTALVLIGWRATEAHFLDFFVRNTPGSNVPMWAASRSSSKSALEAFEKFGFTGDHTALPDSFSELIANRTMSDILSRAPDGQAQTTRRSRAR